MLPRKRSAFTLIELLVVIAIIAILAGLTLAGVMRFLILGPKITTQTEIGQFGTAIGKFKQEKMIYPPSKIKLCSNRSEYGGTPLDLESIRYISQIWPKIGNWTNISWSGSGNLPAGGVILEGDQCLVFFLGGIPNPSGPGTLGFSKDVTNPANFTIGTGVKYADFAGSRLFLRVSGNPFYSYKDGFGNAPYLYFSHGFVKNGYHDGVNNPAALNDSVLGVSPFFGSTSNGVRQYLLPDTFQIVSAGADSTFGTGGAWNSSTPATGTGADDLTNIQGPQMGAVQ